jgi:hypothetical protein
MNSGGYFVYILPPCPLGTNGLQYNLLHRDGYSGGYLQHGGRLKSEKRIVKSEV